MYPSATFGPRTTISPTPFAGRLAPAVSMILKSLTMVGSPHDPGRAR